MSITITTTGVLYFFNAILDQMKIWVPVAREFPYTFTAELSRDNDEQRVLEIKNPENERIVRVVAFPSFAMPVPDEMFMWSIELYVVRARAASLEMDLAADFRSAESTTIAVQCIAQHAAEVLTR